MSSRQPPGTDLSRFYGLFPQPGLARDLFNIIEGHRVDESLRRVYPGLRRDMAVVRAATGDRRPEIASLPDAQAVVEVLLQSSLGLEPDLTDVPPATQEVMQQARSLIGEVEDEGATVSRSAEVTARLYVLVDDGLVAPGATPPLADGAAHPPPPAGDEADGDPDAPPEPGQGGGADDYEVTELPPFMTPIMEELVRQQQQEQTASPEQADGAGQADDETTSEGGEEGEPATTSTDGQLGSDQRSPDDLTVQTSQGQIDDAAPPAPGAAADARRDDAEGGSDSPEQTGSGDVPLVDAEPEEDDLGEQLYLYDEWDHKIEDYRPAWCTVREHRATRTQEGFVAATFHEYGGIVTQIRRNFQLMRPERLRKMRYQVEGDDLDTDGLVEYVVDRRARVAPSGRVYIKRDKTERDVTTAFLVDMSSSTDRKIDGRKRIIDIEKEGLLLMCEALEAIRDEYAIYGFSGSGREECEYYVVKELGERYDDRVKARIGGIYAHQKTRMGPAIRHATRRLAAADSSVKLMILLTDGKPYDSDTYQDNTYAQEDTRVALREARREKIHLFCVTVDREAADYLPNMYSDANYVIIDDVRTLPQKLPQLYRRLTT